MPSTDDLKERQAVPGARADVTDSPEAAIISGRPSSRPSSPT
jgi:hypothetical protein